MKSAAFVSVVLSSILPLSTALAQQKMDDMKGMDMPMGDRSKAQTHHATGVVKKLDATKGTVTFAHGPVKSLDWPTMSMTFEVKDKAMLEKLVVGKKFNFDFVEQGSGYVVTNVK